MSIQEKQNEIDADLEEQMMNELVSEGVVPADEEATRKVIDAKTEELLARQQELSRKRKRLSKQFQNERQKAAHFGPLAMTLNPKDHIFRDNYYLRKSLRAKGFSTRMRH